MSRPFIQAVRPLPRDPGRVTVVVDGASMGALRRDLAERLGVREGERWTVKLERAVTEAVAEDGCRADALSRLGRRDMAAALLVERLSVKWDPALAERVVQALTREGWLDDRAYARRRAELLQRRAPMAHDALQERLEAEGVATRTARAAAREGCAQDRMEAQVAAWRARGRDAASVARALGRQGFDSDTILQALRKAGFPCDHFD